MPVANVMTISGSMTQLFVDDIEFVGLWNTV